MGCFKEQNQHKTSAFNWTAKVEQRKWGRWFKVGGIARTQPLFLWNLAPCDLLCTWTLFHHPQKMFFYVVLFWVVLYYSIIHFFRSIYKKNFRNLFVIENKFSLSYQRVKLMPESPKVTPRWYGWIAILCPGDLVALYVKNKNMKSFHVWYF